MSPSRSIALVGLLLLAAGCVAAPPTGPGQASPGPATVGTATSSPAPIASATAMPAGTPTPGAATPAPGNSPAVTPSPAGPITPPPASASPTCGPVYELRTSGTTVILTGYVHDEDGASLDDAVVVLRSLDVSVPYQATARAAEGQWVVNNLPEGANLEVLAGKEGYTQRRRVGAFNRHPQVRNEADFGRPTVMRSPGFCRPAAADGNLLNALSRFPEVAKVARGADAATADRTLVLTFSHRFDTAQRARLAGALRLFATAATPFDGPDTAIGVAAAEIRDPVIRAGAIGTGADKAPGTKDHAPLTWVVAPTDAASGATATWSEAGDVLTVTLPAAPPAGAELGFVVPTDGAPILAQGPESPRVWWPEIVGWPSPGPDGLARPFGGDRTGARGVYPTVPGTLLRNVFWEKTTIEAADLDRDGAVTPTEAWAAAHATVARWPGP